MVKIAITGKAASGKNTVAKLICKSIHHTQSPVHLAFADPIKEMAQTLFPHLPPKYLYGSSKYRSEVISSAFKDGKPLTVRQLLIDLGTAGRQYNHNIWIDILRHRLEVAQKKNPSIIIVNDVRFKNEFDFLKKLGFYQIRLYRDEHTKIDHASETDQDTIQDSQFDCILDNNGTLFDLKNNVQRIAPLIPQ
jgi:deoxynucleotide monophosphate kinase-like protein